MNTFGPFYVGDKPLANAGIKVQWDGGGDAPLTGTTVVAKMTAPDGHVTTLSAYVNDDTIVVEWPSDSPFTQPGAYVIQAKVTNVVGDTQTISPLGFVVLDALGVQTAWANVGLVKTITGKDVDTTLILQAQAQIEILAKVLSVQAFLFGDTPQPGQIIAVGVRDSQLLRYAVAYQAAWIDAQPDLFDRNEVSSMSQDGASANFTALGMTISPHAQQAVRRLSWMGARSVTLTPATAPRRTMVDVLDDALPWSPM